MARRMFAIATIFIGLAISWFVLAGSVAHRTWSADQRLSGEVAGLWGAEQTQLSPEITFTWKTRKTEREEVENAKTGAVQHVKRERWVWEEKPVILDRSRIDVDLALDHRKKGLLWYSTYGVEFDGSFAYVHDEEHDGFLVISYRFPTTQASYDAFHFAVDGSRDPNVAPIGGDGTKIVERRVPVRVGQEIVFEIGYRTRGLDHWRYSFGDDVNRVKHFTLTATTDFQGVDFSDGSISPVAKTPTEDGWELTWSFENLISGFSIGIEMPRKLNPGPLAAQIASFAPVSLGFFFVWMFVITLLRDIRLHPVNYLFLGAAFFSFHLLFSYTVDHISVAAAFVIASVVSVALVVSYLRLVVGLRFAAIEAGLSQIVYLVLFSYAHFLEGITGLAVTIGGILTLFALMQLTGRIDWAEKFATLSLSGTSRAPVTPQKTA